MSSNHDDYYDSSQTSDVSNKLHSSVDLLTLRTLSTRGNFSSQENEKKKKSFWSEGSRKEKRRQKKVWKMFSTPLFLHFMYALREEGDDDDGGNVMWIFHFLFRSFFISGMLVFLPYWESFSLILYKKILKKSTCGMCGEL